MSRTMRDDAIRNDTSACMARPGQHQAHQAHQARPALLDEHCDHTNLNAEGTRCLGCGIWAHQFVTGLR